MLNLQHIQNETRLWVMATICPVFWAPCLPAPGILTTRILSRPSSDAVGCPYHEGATLDSDLYLPRIHCLREICLVDTEPKFCHGL